MTPIDTAASSLRVLKRDGKTVQRFDKGKIEKAVLAACKDQASATQRMIDPQIVDIVVNDVESNAAHMANGTQMVGIEQIQDLVVETMKVHGLPEAAASYDSWRQKRNELRSIRLSPDPASVQQYIHPAKYARHVSTLKRRELYPESSARVRNMNLRNFADKLNIQLEGDASTLGEAINWAFEFVDRRETLPSMRAMQFAGEAIERNHARGYNCAFSLVDRPRVFAETMWLLLSGCGTGYSIQWPHVDKLPALKWVNTDNVKNFVIPDTIEGWADAVDELVKSYLKGYHIEFAYHKIRSKGSPLRVSGGKAPGHLPLKKALERVRSVLHGAQGRKLRPIECHHIMCMLADAVLSGGIRRSSLIAIFSADDGEMMTCKTGDWSPKAPWLALANNSVALYEDTKKDQFKRVFSWTRQWGEPGLIFMKGGPDTGYNPCCEIGLHPVLTITEDVMPILDELKQRGRVLPAFKLGDSFTGWGFCNLTTINASTVKSVDDLMERVKAAAVIGTLQAAYTVFPYLSWVSEAVAMRDALIGVSQCGILDSPEITMDAETQTRAANLVIETNEIVAKAIGINPAARTTAVKPEGTASLLLGCTGSGVHAHHARRYFRRVTANALEPVFQYFKSVNPHMCEPKPNGDWVITFPVEAPASAITAKNMGAIEFLEIIKKIQLAWVLPGTARTTDSPGLTHNVSATVNVGDDEWPEVVEYMWANRKVFTGVSFLSKIGDKQYPFAPREAVETDADEAKWQALIENYVPVDWSAMVEDEDTTDLAGEAACAGGKCEL